MKKISYFFLAAVAVLAVTSCSTPKNVAYIQNSDYIDYTNSEFLYDARIMPKDILTVTINTVNPEASAPFNLIVRPTLTSVTSNIPTSGGVLQTYLVDNEGCIDFPVVGKLQVGGLTKSMCEKLIHDKIKRYMNAEENPIVTVRMSNYKISVIGEVNHVKLIRENAKGRKEIHTISLNDANLVSSPYYYLQQNDIIYVEPNSVKARNSAIGTSTTIWISVTGALVSLASLIVNVLK